MKMFITVFVAMSVVALPALQVVSYVAYPLESLQGIYSNTEAIASNAAYGPPSNVELDQNYVASQTGLLQSGDTDSQLEAMQNIYMNLNRISQPMVAYQE